MQQTECTACSSTQKVTGFWLSRPSTQERTDTASWVLRVFSKPEEFVTWSWGLDTWGSALVKTSLLKLRNSQKWRHVFHRGCDLCGKCGCYNQLACYNRITLRLVRSEKPGGAGGAKGMRAYIRWSIDFKRSCSWAAACAWHMWMNWCKQTFWQIICPLEYSEHSLPWLYLHSVCPFLD